MLVLYLEALAALALFLFAVWWTMFSGRKKGELPPEKRAVPSTREEPVPDEEKRGAKASD